MPLGSEKIALLGTAGVSSGLNYWGDGSDGAVSTSGDVTHTVANKNGSYDGDMFVAQYTSLTISSGDTMTVDQPCRGLFVFVKGDCTIDGTLSMSNKGGNSNPTSSGGSDSNAVPTNGIQLGLFTDGGSDSFTNDGTGFDGCGTAIRSALANQDDLSSDGTVLTISKTGASGGASYTSSSTEDFLAYTGNNGSDGTTGGVTLSTGGGGAGGTCRGGSNPGQNAISGGGGTGGAFSGGAGGGGGATHNWAGTRTGGTGGNYGGAGGAASVAGHPDMGGGAGNPGGSGASGGGTGASGSGGILWLLVKGDLTIGGSGSIEADGTDGGTGSGNPGVGGGGTGGGCVFVAYAGTLSNSGTITAARGDRGSGGVYTGSGSNGGAGGVHTIQVLE
jgi:hypothetical protein